MQLIRRNTVKALGFLGLVILSLVAWPVWSASEDYPTKEITIVVPAEPGGAAGNSAQIFAEFAGRYSDRPNAFIINYKPGATGMVGADYLMKQPADGYTLIMISNREFLKLTKDAHMYSFKVSDFISIGTFCNAPAVLSVKKDGPFKKLEDFIDYAKKNPWIATYGTSGVGSLGHLVAESLSMKAGIKLTHVPFQGALTAAVAVMGGHVTCTTVSAGSLGPHVKPEGRLRALVVFSSKRDPELPDVPTAIEEGYDVESGTFMFISLKKGTPKPVLDYLGKIFKKTVDDPKIKSALIRAGWQPMNLGPEETEKLVNKRIETEFQIIKKLGL